MQLLISSVFEVIYQFIGSGSFTDTVLIAPFVFGLLTAVILFFKSLLRSF